MGLLASVSPGLSMANQLMGGDMMSVVGMNTGGKVKKQGDE